MGFRRGLRAPLVAERPAEMCPGDPKKESALADLSAERPAQNVCGREMCPGDPKKDRVDSHRAQMRHTVLSRSPKSARGSFATSLASGPMPLRSAHYSESASASRGRVSASAENGIFLACPAMSCAAASRPRKSVGNFETRACAPPECLAAPYADREKLTVNVKHGRERGQKRRQ